MSENQTPTNPAAELVAVVEDLVERQRQILGALVATTHPLKNDVQAVLLGLRGVVTKLRNGAAGITTPDGDTVEAAAMPLGCGAVVRIHEKCHSQPAGSVGLIIGQARNGPNRYKVMFPGDPCEYSLAAKDVDVVRAIDPQSWWKNKPTAKPRLSASGVSGLNADCTADEAACVHGQTADLTGLAAREDTR